ncbi:MAG: HDOD domain-containing protein [Acidobacteriaceae bacterium]
MQIEGPSGPAAKLPWAHLRIPPFPQVAIRILQLTDSEVAPMRQLSTLISSEPAFASEVLTIANSALYATRSPITSVLQAIAILGTNSLKGLCLTVGIRAYLGKSLNDLTLRAIWRHSLACALIARQLAEIGTIDSDAAYSAGIVHDVGRLALTVISPKPYAQLLEKHQGSASSLLEAERALFGFDHCEAGRHLVSDWKLPSSFEAAVSSHHCPRQKSEGWHMSDLINVSCRIADTVGFSVFRGCEITPYEDLLEELPDRERKSFCPDKEQLAFEISSRINAAEAV